MEYPRAVACGDSGVSIEFGNEIDPALNQLVLALDQALAERAPDGIIETVPTYRALMIHYDPVVTSFDTLAARALDLARTANPKVPATRFLHLPVCYEGRFGIDLDDVSAQLGLSRSVVIDRHLAPDYRVYMLGFQPGFAYLGGLDPTLMLPRRSLPRPGAPAGTISIAAGQCAVHSVEGPSGWHWIGRTPLETFVDGDAPSFALQAGDQVRFYPVTEGDWFRLRHELAAGVAPLERHPVAGRHPAVPHLL